MFELQCLAQVIERKKLIRFVKMIPIKYKTLVSIMECIVTLGNAAETKLWKEHP